MVDPSKGVDRSARGIVGSRDWQQGPVHRFGSGPNCFKTVALVGQRLTGLLARSRDHQRTVSRNFSDWGICSTLDADSSSMK